MSELLLRGGLLTRRYAQSVSSTGYAARVEQSTAIDDLIAWYKLDSSPPVDTRGNLSPGSVVGGVSLLVDELPDVGQIVADFNGTTGYISIADAAGLHLSTGAIHLAIDVESFPATGQFRSIVSKEGTGLTDQDFILALFNNAGAQELRVQFILGGVVHRAIMVNITLGRHWVTLNFGNGQAAALFVDRAPIATISTYTVGINANTRPLLLGAFNLGTGPESFFDGQIAHLQIYGRRLTQAEIDYLSFPLFDDGDYEAVVQNLSPAIYLQFGGDLSDDSGNGRAGALVGSGGSYVTALAGGVGAGNLAFDTEGTASISIPHATSDTALTFSNASPWSGVQTGFRFIAGVDISVWFKANALPTGSNKAVIVAKSANQTPGDAASYVETHPMVATAGSTVPGGSFEAYVDANGALHVEVRSFRGRPARIRTPDGAVTVGATKHLHVQLTYAPDGVTAWLDGAKFEDGYGNPLHVYGLAANIRGINFRNNYAWTIGKAAWGGQADIVVDEFAVFHRNATAPLSQANVNTLAQQGSTPAPLAHHVWGALSVNRSSYASIQAAVDDVSASGGGTVLFNPGTHAGDVVMKPRVRLKRNGTSGTVTLTGTVSAASPAQSTLTDNGTNFLTGDRNLDVSNTRSVGDVFVVMATAATGSPLVTPMRHDRRWNTLSESNDPHVPDGERFLIESRNASSMTAEGVGSSYDFATADRQRVFAFTPTSWVGFEDISIVRTGATAVNFFGAVHARFVNCTIQSNLFDVAHFRESCMYVTFRGCTAILTGDVHVGHMVFSGVKDCVVVNSTGRGRDHTLDMAGPPAYGPCSRIEGHNITHDSPAGSLEVAGLKVGAHGNTTDCVLWNLTIEFGGIGPSGWKADYRWALCGTRDAGAIWPNDGLKSSYVRDVSILHAKHYFYAGEGAVGVDDNHFGNIRRDQAGTVGNHFSMNYGTGANVNTYTNVDAPSGSWQVV